jgi:hypothetical protein
MAAVEKTVIKVVKYTLTFSKSPLGKTTANSRLKESIREIIIINDL